MISAPNETINVQPRDLKNVGVIDRWHRYNFRFVTISGYRNQYIQYFLNAFYHDIDSIKKVSILWSCIHWSKLGICRLKDNAFF